MIDPSRRRFLGAAATVALMGLAWPGAAQGHMPVRALSFHHLNTGESLRTAFWADGAYLPEALRAIDYLMRDFRTGEIVPIDLRLLELMHRLMNVIGSRQPYHLISAYRSPSTNALLREQGRNVAKKSYHLRGMAVDIRLPGTRLKLLRRAAVSLRGGGVGYYPRSRFLHLDCGPVRSW